eukprot:GILI01022956.1.p4 GENE.GILI01022956.1~~GILI01022956.1.p4  ORF type:complete len:110 (-),score=19.48 GILI01022956.1:66-395(-)
MGVEMMGVQVKVNCCAWKYIPPMKPLGGRSISARYFDTKLSRGDVIATSSPSPFKAGDSKPSSPPPGGKNPSSPHPLKTDGKKSSSPNEGTVCLKKKRMMTTSSPHDWW